MPVPGLRNLRKASYMEALRKGCLRSTIWLDQESTFLSLYESSQMINRGCICRAEPIANGSQVRSLTRWS